jgi:hypothetical protein
MPESRPPADRPRKRRRRERIVGILGLALDGKDGETRITKGDEFVLLGGSEETHERMQDFAVHVTERLAKKGKKISDATFREIQAVARDLR